MERIIAISRHNQQQLKSVFIAGKDDCYLLSGLVVCYLRASQIWLS